MYSIPDVAQPIRQGDIFRWLPKPEIGLGDAKLPILPETEENGVREIDWLQLAEESGVAYATIQVRPVCGIVISQDCDTSRSPNITFAEIRPFADVYPNYSDDKTKTKGLVDFVTRHARVNYSWYYLPEYDRFQFARKMAADFESVFDVPREMLEAYKEQMRLGRLDDDVAWPHFRERVAEYYRRYPYNEWYPLNSSELDAYEEDKKIKVDPRYRWQPKQSS